MFLVTGYRLHQVRARTTPCPAAQFDSHNTVCVPLHSAVLTLRCCTLLHTLDACQEGAESIAQQTVLTRKKSLRNSKLPRSCPSFRMLHPVPSEQLPIRG